MSWLFGGNPAQVKFDEAIDNATSELLPSGSDETLLTSLELSDQIRSKSVEASYALKSLRRRISHKNPNVQIQSLHVLDVLLKNSGEAFLLAVGNGKDGWMAELEDVCKSSNHDLRQTATKYLQNWALTFQSSSTSSALSSSDLVHLYNRLKHTLEFPPASQTMTSSMITSLSAPEWVDSDICQRCRTPFTLTNRKHHCRNCGGVFCGDCSSKTMKLEHLGIDQEVRVCDGCYKKLSMPGGRSASVSRQQAAPVNGFRSDAKKTQEDADFERAIALSLAESESSAPAAVDAQSNSLPGVGYGYEARPSRPEPVRDAAPVSLPSKQLEEEDPDLAAAIRASLAEVQPQASTSTAVPSAPPKSSYAYIPQTQPTVPSYELAMSEFDALDSFSNAMRHPHIRPDDANELFTRADRHRGKMYRALEDAHAKSGMLFELNQKLQRAVRLYDSLLERNVSRFSQPYQQSIPQIHEQQHQTQYLNQHYTNSTGPSHTQTLNAGHEHVSPYQQNGHQAYYVPGAAEAASQPYNQYSEPNAYAQAPPLRQDGMAQSQYEQPVLGSAYGTQLAQSSQQYVEHGPVAPPVDSEGHQEQAFAQSQQPDEQYYNTYPVSTPQERSHEASGERYYGQVEGWPQNANVSQDTARQYAPAASRSTVVHAGSPPQATPLTHQTSAEGAAHSHGTSKAESNGRFQGFYSAASFPTVPSLPVGGLPSAPQGEFAESHSHHKNDNPHRKEEALIEF